MSQCFSFVSVSVRDMAIAQRLWQTGFGLEPLSVPWQSATPEVVDEIFLGEPGQSKGIVHLIQYRNPGQPVRAGANTTDLCPKNLDLYCTDLPGRFDQLRALGYEFRAPWSEYGVEGKVVREVQLLGPDDTNIGLMELQGVQVNFSSAGFAGLGPVVCIVPDADAECEFYQSAFGLEMIIHKYLDGPEIEKMIGLPPGAGLDMRVMGHPDQWLGRVEIIQYRGAAGDNRYPLAKPPATGFLSLTYLKSDLLSQPSQAEQLPDNRGLALSTPAGMQIDVLEQ